MAVCTKGPSQTISGSSFAYMPKAIGSNMNTILEESGACFDDNEYPITGNTKIGVNKNAAINLEVKDDVMYIQNQFTTESGLKQTAFKCVLVGANGTERADLDTLNKNGGVYENLV